MPHLNNPSILPGKLCLTPCLDVVELINISKVAQVKLSWFKDVAFIFLKCGVMNNLYCIQGMGNAYVTHFRYSKSAKMFVQLDTVFWT
jgi:hypothetical protein